MDNEDRTRIIRRPGSGAESSQTQEGTRRLGPDETRRVERNPEPPVPRPEEEVHQSARDNGERTVIMGPSRRSSAGGRDVAVASVAPVDHMADPVVGWLVVVSGPGCGAFVRLGYGMNNIGRGDDQRCRLSFGDELVSRQNHASITYDPRGRKFYLQHGGGQNLTYLGNDPVLQPAELRGGEYVTIGTTMLRFMAFCGPEFDYSDIPSQSAS